MVTHNATLQVFRGNTLELNKALGSYTTAMWNAEGPLRLNLEIARLLHNWLASAHSLVDAYRYLLSDHVLPEELTEAYCERTKSAFKESELSQFVKLLRNYALHRSLPPLVGGHRRTEHNGEVTESCTIGLHKAALLEWDNWSPKAKAFLSKQEHFFELGPIVSEYEKSVSGLYAWFSGEIQKIAPRGIELVNFANMPDEVWMELRKFERMNKEKGVA